MPLRLHAAPSVIIRVRVEVDAVMVFGILRLPVKTFDTETCLDEIVGRAGREQGYHIVGYD